MEDLEDYKVVTVEKIGVTENYLYFKEVADLVEYKKLTKEVEQQEVEPEVIIYTNKDGTYKGTGHKNATIINPYESEDYVGSVMVQAGDKEDQEKPDTEEKLYITEDNWRELKEGDTVFIEDTDDRDFEEGCYYRVASIEEAGYIGSLPFRLKDAGWVDFSVNYYKMYKVEE